jgi:hypothetical protein
LVKSWKWLGECNKELRYGDKPKLLAEYFWEMAGYFWLRVENGLFYIVKSSYMAGDEPKWLAGHCKKLIYV